MKNFGNQITGGAGDAGTFSADEANSLMREGENAVLAAGLALTSDGANAPDSDPFQLAKAIGRHVAQSDFYVTGGTANAITLTTLGSYRPINEYLNGMRVRFIAGANNSGPVTVNVNGIGVKPLRKAGGVSSLVANDLISGEPVLAEYYASTDSFNCVVFPGLTGQQDQSATIVSGQTLDGTATVGKIVFWNAGGNNWVAANSAVAREANCGISLGSGRVLLSGLTPPGTFAGLTPGLIYYQSATDPSGLTTVYPGEGRLKVGLSYSATQILVDFDFARQSGVGQIEMWAGISAPPVGTLYAAGPLLSRATFSDLWAFVQANARLVSEAAWAAGDFGTYSTGDGSTTFRAPDFRAMFMRGFDGGRNFDPGRLAGSFQKGTLGTGDPINTGQTVNGMYNNADANPVTFRNNIGADAVRDAALYPGLTALQAAGSALPDAVTTWGHVTRPDNVPVLVTIRY